MLRLEWSPEYECGVESIDDDHRALIHKFAEVARMMATGADAAVITQAVGELFAFAKLHMEQEEAEIAALGLPSGNEHSAAHREMSLKVAQAQVDMAQGKKWTTEQVLDAGRQLIEHIVEWDVPLGKAVAAKLVNP
jgi:hemerythrin